MHTVAVHLGSLSEQRKAQLETETYKGRQDPLPGEINMFFLKESNYT